MAARTAGPEQTLRVASHLAPNVEPLYEFLAGYLAARLGRRATEDEVRQFFAPYGEYAALAGCYALQRRF